MPARALTLTPSERGGTGPQPIQAVLYVRVSSKTRKEVLSIPAQARPLRDYAAQHGFDHCAGI
jgi:hypothetical protein